MFVNVKLILKTLILTKEAMVKHPVKLAEFFSVSYGMIKANSIDKGLCASDGEVRQVH